MTWQLNGGWSSLDGRAQGRVLGYLTAEGDGTRRSMGTSTSATSLLLRMSAMPYWVDRRAPFHVCSTYGGQCEDETILKDVMHVDV